MKKTFILSNRNIGTVIEEVDGFFRERHVSDRDIMKLRLAIEEALLRFRDHFGNRTEAVMDTGKWGSPSITFRVKGNGFDPIENDAGEIINSRFIVNLLEEKGVSAAYRYRNGFNEVVFSAARETKKPKIIGGSVTAAAVLGLVCALLCRHFMPAQAQAFLLEDLASPLMSSLMGLILLITGPLIFISVVSGICALEDVATLSSIGLRVIFRFFVITVLLITFSMLVCFPFFPGLTGMSEGAFSFPEILHLLFELIPKDIVSPFVEGKTIQIILLAALFGISILILGNSVSGIKDLIPELNQLFFQAMMIVSKAVPLTIFLSIFKTVMTTDVGGIVKVWKAVVSNLLALLLFAAGMLAYLSVRRKVDIREFLNKVSPVLMVSFSTASSSLSMAKNYEVCRDNLGLDDRLCGFWIPLSHAMFSPSIVTPLVVATFFCSEYYGSPVSLSRLLIMYILTIQLSIASPKIPGGIMATFTILLSQLGMPLDAVGLMMVTNTFVVNAGTMLGMLIREIELVEFTYVLQDDKTLNRS